MLGLFGGGNNNCCSLIIILILLFFFCGNGFDNGCGCERVSNTCC